MRDANLPARYLNRVAKKIQSQGHVASLRYFRLDDVEMQLQCDTTLARHAFSRSLLLACLVRSVVSRHLDVEDHRTVPKLLDLANRLLEIGHLQGTAYILADLLQFLTWQHFIANQGKIMEKLIAALLRSVGDRTHLGITVDFQIGPITIHTKILGPGAELLKEEYMSCSDPDRQAGFFVSQRFLEPLCSEAKSPVGFKEMIQIWELDNKSDILALVYVIEKYGSAKSYIAQDDEEGAAKNRRGGPATCADDKPETTTSLGASNRGSTIMSLTEGSLKPILGTRVSACLLIALLGILCACALAYFHDVL
ncbi:hypothetical protein BU23DRAFT_12716 [Bimuria novae-zelandiae CBS 107.79]|uniref:Uncharacterized protein n=1 Tax=Bimuria novae-zelandiae CBS 107.79 TaxID=1447943 RepID=A0A6A5VGX5_9PLEO|nr:hypothetical protein BU23DRAFT_12716 [Bimuria novae-zelandiae CBS 107.79]